MVISRRDHLVQVAQDEFAAHGFHGTGIDGLLAKAGVSKKTLYAHFRSKEELIVAVLRGHDTNFRDDFKRDVEALADDPKERLLAVFDVASDWFHEKSFYGCIFINAVAEYSEGTSPIREACRDFKQMMKTYIIDLARDASLPQPGVIGAQLALLLEGATVTAQVSGDKNAALIAKEAARSLIASALTPA
ncbi:MAG: TetR/AcrR family transcriptional regulator [Parvibaculum sp.]